MFKLVVIEDVIQVPARLFGYPRLQALEHTINKRLSDKVIPGAGLCIAFWDWVEVGEDSLQIQTGDANTKCTFRVVCFAPFEGEAVFGRVSGACESGVFVEVGFFDAIAVPKEGLPKPCVFDEKERVWIWKPKFNDEEHTYYMDVSNESVLRVMETVYDDQRKLPPSQREIEGRNPMSIVGALHDAATQDNQGLGDPLWWFDEGEAGEAEGHEGEEGYDGAEDAGDGGYGANGAGEADRYSDGGNGMDAEGWEGEVDGAARAGAEGNGVEESGDNGGAVVAGVAEGLAKAEPEMQARGRGAVVKSEQ